LLPRRSDNVSNAVFSLDSSPVLCRRCLLAKVDAAGNLRAAAVA
jgi:hypothetical protein